MEIVGLPVVGALTIEMLHNRRNELVLLFLPFGIAVVRLFIAQFQVPPFLDDDSKDSGAIRSARTSIAFNQVSVFVLILFESGVVVAGSPDTPMAVWAFVLAILALYVALRVLSRNYWIAASQDG